MSHRHAHTALKRLLNSGVELMAQMPYVSELLKRLAPSFSLSMIRVDERGAPREHYSEFFDSFSHELFAHSGHLFATATDDPAAFARLLRAPVPYGNLVHGGAAFENGATYQHLFKRNGIHHCLDVALRDASGPIGILGIFRERRAPAFNRSEVAAIAEVYPALVHAMRAPPLPASFETCDEALLVTDTDGVIEWASEHGRAWLADALGCPGQRHLLDNRLPEACRALASRLERGELPTMTLPVPAGRVRLRAYRLNALAEREGAARVAIQLTLEMNSRLKLMRALDEAPLTDRLRSIALAHADGLTAEQIRDRLGLTKNTLKSYQKDLYGRLEVSSASELVELLRAQAQAVTFDLRRHRPRAQNSPMPPTAVGGSGD